MRTRLAAVADRITEYGDYFHSRTTSVLQAIPERVAELRVLHHRFSAFGHESPFLADSYWRHRTFPLQIVDPRLGTPDIRTITVKDAREYFDLMLGAAQPAIEAYESFIEKYSHVDAAGQQH